MPIRAQNSYEAKNPIKYTIPIKALKGNTIAIDGFWYIRKYFSPISREKLLLNLENYVKENLSFIFKLKEISNILWIWDGMKYKQEKPGFEELKDVETFASDLNSSDFYSVVNKQFFVDHLVEPVNSVLASKKIDFCRAPYGAIAQCVYYYKNRFVDCIFTKSDALVFTDCEQVITDFNLKEEKYFYVTKKDLSKNLDVPLSHVKHFSIASGCDFCPTIPPLALAYSNEDLKKFFTIEKGEENQTNLRFKFQRYLEENEGYKKFYTQALTNIKWHPVMSTKGEIIPLESTEFPKNLDVIFGKKFPSIFYENLFLCKIKPHVLNRINRNNYFKDNFVGKILSKICEFAGRDEEINRQLRDSKNKTEYFKNLLNLNYDSYKGINSWLELACIHMVSSKTIDSEELNVLSLVSDVELENTFFSEQKIKLLYVLQGYLDSIQVFLNVSKEFGNSKRPEDFKIPELSLKNAVGKVKMKNHLELIKGSIREIKKKC
ncbi:hypothetical protein NUSPORA_01498 [Nucleospora cyclopteri]